LKEVDYLPKISDEMLELIKGQGPVQEIDDYELFRVGWDVIGTHIDVFFFFSFSKCLFYDFILNYFNWIQNISSFLILIRLIQRNTMIFLNKLELEPIVNFIDGTFFFFFSFSF